MYTDLPPAAGNLVFANLPTHLNRGQPGLEPRLCLVLALEVNADNNSLEGLWLVRLSERLEKIRHWDYVITSDQMDDTTHAALKEDYVIRTPRIDLIPVDASYMDDIRPVGRVKDSFWEQFAPQLDKGQRSSFFDGSYGPRDQKADCIVKLSLDNDECFSSFDHEMLLERMIAKPEQSKSILDDAYGMAVGQMTRQAAALRKMIHGDFMSAIRRGQGWNWEDYKSTTLPVRLQERNLRI